LSCAFPSPPTSYLLHVPLILLPPQPLLLSCAFQSPPTSYLQASAGDMSLDRYYISNIILKLTFKLYQLILK
jgi:hypothetical protein